MDFWKRFKQLFSGSSSSDPSAEHKRDAEDEREEEKAIEEHKELVRSQTERNDYDLWLRSENHQATLHWIWDQHQNKQPGQRDKNIDFLNIPSVSGLVVYYDSRMWTQEQFRCLFDYLAARMLELGYRTQVSDTKIRRAERGTERMERHYLKPPISLLEQFEKKQPLNQRYGNVMVTLCGMDGEWVNIKFSATHYNDRCYRTALPFEELLQLICSGRG